MRTVLLTSLSKEQAMRNMDRLSSGEKFRTFQVKKPADTKYVPKPRNRWIQAMVTLSEQGLAVAWVCVGLFVGWISAVIYYRF